AAIDRAREFLEGPAVDVEMERVLTHADPTDANILHFAHSLLEAGRTELIDRYLPTAIEAATLQDDPRLSLDLAQRWQHIRPESLEAAFCVTREAFRAGEKLDWETVSAQLPASANDPRALVIQMVIECADQDQEQWAVTAKLLSAIETKQIDAIRAQGLIRDMIAVQPANESLLVHSGVLEINSGNPGAAFQLLSSVRPSDPLAYYVGIVACARAALAAGESQAALDALNRAIELYEKPEIAAFADICPILRLPHDMFSIGKSVAGSLQQQGDALLGATLLEKLTALKPNREDLARAYADALAKSGKREIAVARLEAMLQTHETNGNSEGVLLTIQSILQIAPGNLRLRGRLIDEFMKRGLLQEAVQERWTQAQILERAGRIDDAVDQLRRALDVASMLGDWKKLENIVRMMIRIQPEDLDVRHSAATKFIEYGQIQLAIEQLWAAVNISSTLDDPDEAIAALHQIIALGPQQIDAYHKLGEVLATVGEYAQAERVYRRLSTLIPDDPAILAKQSALAAMANGPE
ncbi:MAG: tetratricopeptide repeat protein, partial [Nitrolancea sp.]